VTQTCRYQDTGAIELYFYDEVDAAERAGIAAHVRHCRECASTLEDLRTIRAALAARPDIAAPPSGDWSAFMGRLNAAVREIRPGTPAAETIGPSRQNVATFRPRPVAYSYAGLVAMAALLAIVTIGVVFVARQRTTIPVWQDSVAGEATPSALTPVGTTGLRSAGARHFERSKLVVLGLAARESEQGAPSEWAYERELATSLLNDTRLYRMAAEERGLATLAGIMRDLEIVLLETSMAEDTDSAALEQIQRLIRKRGLIQKMDTVASAGM
jgi:hypothetical protein